MTMTRSLPGITFRAELPQNIPLPRMDIAAFVGFAARGPLHVPVAIEEVAHFQEIFGDPPQLAWDRKTDSWQTACLGLAVRDFFAQGGRRCWVVRVAGDAVTNTFPVAGLLRAELDGLHPATIEARSPGSWSDQLEVSASLLVDPLGFETATLPSDAHGAIQVHAFSGPELLAGDLIQLDFADPRQHRAYLQIDTLTLADNDAISPTTRLAAGPLHWFHPLAQEAGANGTPISGTVQIYTGASAGIYTPAELDSSTMQLTVTGLDLETAPESGGERNGHPQPGDWLTLSIAGGSPATGRLWLLVDQVTATTIDIAQAWWEGVDTENDLPLARAIRVGLALNVRQGDALRSSVSDLACAAPHPRFLDYLPTDESLFRSLQGEPEAAEGVPGAVLWPDVTNPRFPLAGSAEVSGILIPLGLSTTLMTWRGPEEREGLPLQRDGLTPSGANLTELTAQEWATFFQELYLDPVLRLVGQANLLIEAFDRRFVQGQILQGLHSTLALDEISLLALPDAAHRGWHLVERIAPEPLPEPPPVAPPPGCPGHDLFQPKVQLDDSDVVDGEETETPDAPRPMQMATAWELLPPATHNADGLLEIQQQAVQLAAARADLVTILGLPVHVRAQDALVHRQRLGQMLDQVTSTTASYAALYHPWLITRDAAGCLRNCTPVGAICGIIAARSILRGAWVAPANQSIQGALALLPQLEQNYHADLYMGNVNLIRRDAGEFVLWGADTLSKDPELNPLNVRRLLILLRRIVLREGQKYVFATHSPAFRRRVTRQFQHLLAGLFTRGAFAGRDPAQAYRVVTEETVNTPASIEQGRFIVELRVAPSQPMAFITVRLIQTSTETLAIQEGVALA